MRKLVLCATASLSMSVFAGDIVNQEDGEYLRTDDYTLTRIAVRNDQYRPLDAIITVALSEDISSVGEAITEVLSGSGYSWKHDGADMILDDLPLPVIVLELGPLPLKDALTTLAGPAWSLRKDELTRQVWFEVSDEYLEHPSLTQAAED